MLDLQAVISAGASVCSSYRSFSNLIIVIFLSISIFCFFHLNFCHIGLPSYTLFFPFSQLTFPICSLFISNCCFQLQVPLAFRYTQSNSTSFIYCGESRFSCFFQVFSLTDSSLSSHLPFQSLYHKLHLLSSNSFPCQNPS